MKVIPHVLLLISALILTTHGQRQDPVVVGNGVIEGTVSDEAHRPLAGVKVRASTSDHKPGSSFVRFVRTNDSGHFIIEHLPFGTYRIFTKDEEADYPDTGFSFYSNDVFPTATLTSAIPMASVQLNLGPKAAVLSGRILDSDTGEPLSATFKLTRATASDKWISSQVRSPFRILVPASTPIQVEISAPGYQKWSYGGSGDAQHRRDIELKPASKMELDVSLRPTDDATLRRSRFLIPEGFIGWIRLDHDISGASPVPLQENTQLYKFPASGTLETSSPGPVSGARDEYLFYSKDGSTKVIPQDFRKNQGMIWDKHVEFRGGEERSFEFFVGTEDQFKKSTRPLH